MENVTIAYETSKIEKWYRQIYSDEGLEALVSSRSLHLGAILESCLESALANMYSRVRDPAVYFYTLKKENREVDVYIKMGGTVNPVHLAKSKSLAFIEPAQIGVCRRMGEVIKYSRSFRSFYGATIGTIVIF